MSLSKKDAIRFEMVDVGTQKGGRYRKRIGFYTFQCVSCSVEIRVSSSDVKKVSGRCRKCADKDTATTNSEWNRLRPYEALFNRFTYDRQRAGQSSSISYDDFLQFTKQKNCHYCKDQIHWAEFSLERNGYRYNLDRMDNDLGYHKDNLVVCCWHCNETKGSRFTYQEFMKLSPALQEIREKRKPLPEHR